jgi:hypothetical protein
MLILISVVLGVLLSASIVTNILLWIAGDRQMTKSDIYEQMYNDIVIRMKERIMNTYVQMKQLDDKAMFSKDDEVGVSFQQILEILQELNKLTQEEEETPNRE